jgi:hypothetical protein
MLETDIHSSLNSQFVLYMGYWTLLAEGYGMPFWGTEFWSIRSRNKSCHRMAPFLPYQIHISSTTVHKSNHPIRGSDGIAFHAKVYCYNPNIPAHIMLALRLSHELHRALRSCKIKEKRLVEISLAIHQTTQTISFKMCIYRHWDHIDSCYGRFEKSGNCEENFTLL